MQMPIGEASADNKRADAVTFYLSLQDRKGTCLIYSSFQHCTAEVVTGRRLSWPQAAEEAVSSSSTHSGTRMGFAQVAQTLPRQPPCPHPHQALLQNVWLPNIPQRMGCGYGLPPSRRGDPLAFCFWSKTWAIPSARPDCTWHAKPK